MDRTRSDMDDAVERRQRRGTHEEDTTQPVYVGNCACKPAARDFDLPESRETVELAAPIVRSAVEPAPLP